MERGGRGGRGVACGPFLPLLPRCPDHSSAAELLPTPPRRPSAQPATVRRWRSSLPPRRRECRRPPLHRGPRTLTPIPHPHPSPSPQPVRPLAATRLCARRRRWRSRAAATGRCRIGSACERTTPSDTTPSAATGVAQSWASEYAVCDARLLRHDRPALRVDALLLPHGGVRLRAARARLRGAGAPRLTARRACMALPAGGGGVVEWS